MYDPSAWATTPASLGLRPRGAVAAIKTPQPQSRFLNTSVNLRATVPYDSENPTEKKRCAARRVARIGRHDGG